MTHRSTPPHIIPWPQPPTPLPDPEVRQPAPSAPPTDPWASANPDAPLITRRHRQRSGEGASRSRRPRGRTITTEDDLLAPSSVDRRSLTVVRSGQSYSRTFAVLTLPRSLRPAALAGIMRLPGVQTVVVNNPLPRPAAKERLMQLARQMGVSLAQTTTEEEAADELLALKDVRRVLAAVTEEASTLHMIGIYLTVAGANLPELNERCRHVQEACADAQIQIVACDGQHWEGLLTTAPLGHDHVRYLFETDTPTLARLIPSGTRTMQPSGGAPIFYGVRADGSGVGQVAGVPVILDRFALPSPHQAVIAATGGGKTYQQSFALMQRFAYGNCDICVLDPKDQEYRRLIEEVLGGTYLVLSPSAEVHLNPLAVPWGDAAVVERLRTINMDMRARRASFVKQLVAAEAIARGMPLSGAAEAALEEAIFACYQQRGMTEDPATYHADAPTLRTVAAYLADHASDPALQAALHIFTHGTIGRLLHGDHALPFTIPTSRLRDDVGVLGVDLSAFVQGQDQTLQRVLPALIADYFMTVALRGTGRKMELVIDEAWSVLNTAAGAQTIEMLARIGRSLGVAVTIITQQLREFVTRRVGDHTVPNPSGITFLDNCETILLLRQLRPARTGAQDDDNPIMQAAKRFALTPGEVQWLSQCRRDADGVTGLLIAGREPIPLRIPRAPAPIHALLTKGELFGTSHAADPHTEGR